MTLVLAPDTADPSPPPGPRRRSGRPGGDWWSDRRPLDAVAILTLLLGLVLFIPSPLIVRPLGAVGTPANLCGLGLLVWWGLAKVGSGHGVDRGRQPLRIALFVVLVSLAASLIGFAQRYTIGAEKTGAVRGLLGFAALAGIALFAADGIRDVERVRVLLRRIVAGVSIVAGIGIVEFVTGFNPGQAMAVPGLVRNLELADQGRLLFLRVQSTALHPIELGAVLGLTLPLAVELAIWSEGRRRILAWVQVALIGAVLPMSLSRTGVIAATIGLVVVAWHWDGRRKLLALGALAGFVGALRLVLPAMIDGLVTIFVTVGEDESTTGRTGDYEVAATLFLERPWVGRGLSTLHPATGHIFDNQYLYTATETGLVGVVAILALFLTVLAMTRVVHHRAPDPDIRGVAQALTGLTAAMAVVYATADMASFAIAMTLFFLLAGVTGALWRLTAAEPPRGSP